MRRNVSFAALVLAIVAVGCQDASLASRRAASEPVTLRLDPEVGSTHNYDGVLTMRMGEAGSATLKFTTTREVVSNDEKGIVIKDSISKVSAEGEGELKSIAGVASMFEGRESTTTYGKDGRIKEAAGGGGADPSSQSSFHMVFPEKPVKPGDTWEGQLSTQGQEVKAKFRAQEYEEIEGRTALRVAVAMESVNGLQMEGPITLWVDIKDGMQLKGEARLKLQDGARALELDIDSKKLP